MESLTRQLCLSIRGSAITTLQKLALLGAEVEVGIVPSALEANSRVQDRQAKHGNDNHNWLKNHECKLVANEQLAVETSPEFNASIDGTDHNGDGGDEETTEEGFEECRGSDRDVFRVPVSFGADDGEGEGAANEEEKRESEDLEDETGDHDVTAHIVHGLGIRRRGNCTTGGL